MLRRMRRRWMHRETKINRPGSNASTNNTKTKTKTDSNSNSAKGKKNKHILVRLRRRQIERTIIRRIIGTTPRKRK